MAKQTKRTPGGGRGGGRESSRNSSYSSVSNMRSTDQRVTRSSVLFQPYDAETNQGRSTPQHPIQRTPTSRPTVNAGSPSQEGNARTQTPIPTHSMLSLGPLRSASTSSLAIGAPSPPMNPIVTSAPAISAPVSIDVPPPRTSLPSILSHDLYHYPQNHSAQQSTPDSTSGFTGNITTNDVVEGRYIDDEERQVDVDRDEQNGDDDDYNIIDDYDLMHTHRNSQTATHETFTIASRNIQRVDLDIREATDPDLIQYFEKIRRHVYLHSAFPDVRQGHELSTRFSREIDGVTPEDQRRFIIPDDIRKLVRTKASDFRISAHSGMKDVLLRYEFDPRPLPRNCKTRGRAQYRYLLDGSRFAREGSVSTGALLQNRSIGECLYLLMYNTNGGAARLSPPPEEITREFIALAYVMMFYRMVLMYGFQSVRPEWQNQFSEGSHWHKTYDRIIQGYGMGEDDLVDWEAVIEFQSSIIQGMHSRDGSQHATSNPEAFFQALYPDGVDFDDN